jgi:predicted nucleic acid-binding protein
MSKPFVLVDTSSWVPWLRKHGDPVVRRRLQELIDDRRAALCPIVRLELRNGVRGSEEKSKLTELESKTPDIDISPEVWEAACDLAVGGRSRGLTVPAADILIFACAQHHGLEIEAEDKHFDLLQNL